jgi:uncharacterized ferritin-like protein (DUF455 family)
MSETPSPRGLSIHLSAEHLRNYVAVARACLKAAAGWFLACRPYEVKYRLAYHAYDHSEHVTWLRARLAEMRGGRPDASVRPGLKRLLAEVLDAPDESAFLHATYSVLLPALLEAYRRDIAALDPSANANELRLFKRIVNDLEAQVDGFIPTETSPAWTAYLRGQLAEIGGIHGDSALSSDPAPRPPGTPFQRPATILFDDRVARRPLMSYEARAALDERGTTVEQFKVFFNEFYAAALLASILYDAAEDDLPWDFHREFTRHFWDEARHSEFGMLRLRELGVDPDRCDPILYEHSQGLPVLHRVAYLTRGLEAYFMPRKPKRFREYEDRGDTRSQLFADQDWSDEMNHVRYGSRWTDFLLEDDSRDLDDILEEVKRHLTALTGQEVATINAPF